MTWPGRSRASTGVSSAKLGDNDPADPPDEDDDAEPDTPEDIADYMQGANALITVTFDGEEDDDSAKAAMQDIRTLLSDYDAYISTTVGVSQADTLAQEMTVILAIAAVIIVLVLLITSRSYAELPVMILTFASAALLNMGTNFWFGTISFISNSVTVVLQLALAIDYAIILLHRFTEERQTCDTRQACINAVSYSIPAIASSSLTTISGLGAHAVHAVRHRPGHGYGAHQGHLFQHAVGVHPDARPADAVCQRPGQNPAQGVSA